MIQYKLLSVNKSVNRTVEVEEAINELSEQGWEAVGYSAAGFRGFVQAEFIHMILFKKTVVKVI